LVAAVALLAVAGGRAAADEAAPPATAPTSQPAATDWPNFMGPNRNGVVEGGPRLLQKWPEKGPRLIWQSGPLPRAPQCGLGAPVVMNGRVYTYADVALPVDGIFPFDDKTLLEDAGFAPDMPPDVVKAVDAVRVSEERKKLGDFLDLVNGPKDRLAKFEDMIQKLLASLDPQAKKYEKVIRGRMRLGGEYGKGFGKNDWDWLAAHRKLEVKTSAEFIRVANSLGGDWDGGRVHAAHFMNLNSNKARIYKDEKWGDMLICLDAATGKILWEQTCPGVVHGESGHEVRLSGTPAAADGRVFMRGSGGLHCLDAKDGKLLWEVQGPPGHNSPIVAGDVVYCYLPDLTALDARTGRKLWRQPALENAWKTPALWFHDGKKYVLGSDRGGYDCSATTCVDGDTGKILWRIEFKTNFQSPVVAGDTLVLRHTKIAAYKLSPDKVEQLWSVRDFGDHGGSCPSIGNGYVYSMGNCYGGPAMQVLDLNSGKGSIHAYGTRAGTPIVADGMIFTMSDMAPKGEQRREDCPIMALKATPDKYEEVGLIRFDRTKEDHRSDMDLSTLAIAGGKLYVRLNETIACYDLTE
jgi:outer membrane protein assembly factor BamB